MNRFFDLLEQSTLISGIIALGLVGTSCYLAITGQPIPDMLAAATMAVVGFFFGAKTEKSATSLSPKMKG